MRIQLTATFVCICFFGSLFSKFSVLYLTLHDVFINLKHGLHIISTIYLWDSYSFFLMTEIKIRTLLKCVLCHWPIPNPSLMFLLCHRCILRKLCDTSPYFDIAGFKHMFLQSTRFKKSIQWKETRNRAIHFHFGGLGHNVSWESWHWQLLRSAHRKGHNLYSYNSTAEHLSPWVLSRYFCVMLVKGWQGIFVSLVSSIHRELRVMSFKRMYSYYQRGNVGSLSS